MTRWWAGAAVAAGMLVGTPAFAGGDWGTDADAKVCADLSKWSGPECQGEIAKRQKACLADPDMQMDLGAVGYAPGQENDQGRALCKKEATKEIQKQLASASKAKADAAAAERAEKEALQKRELPKATGRVPAIEQMVASNFSKNYPEKKLLKVVLDGATTWEVKKNGLGIVVSRSVWATVASKKGDKCELYGTYWEQQHTGKGFSGPLVEHGQGAAEWKEILCERVK